MDTGLSYERYLRNRWKSIDRVLDNIKMYCYRKVEIESSYKRVCTVVSHFSKNTHTCIEKPLYTKLLI